MAKPVSYTKTPEDEDVILEMVEPSFRGKGGEETIGLYFERDGAKKKIDYVLVYERCQEKEDKNEESRQDAEKAKNMRKAFEASLESAGLLIERVERQCSKVSSVTIYFCQNNRLNILAHSYSLISAKKFRNFALNHRLQVVQNFASYTTRIDQNTRIELDF